MSEKFPLRASTQESAKYVAEMHASVNSLSQPGKSLGEIDPIVAGFVDADSKSQYFGRIEKVDVAKLMADERNAIYDSEHLPGTAGDEYGTEKSGPEYRAAEQSDDEQIDRTMAGYVRRDVATDHTPEEANKAAQDYLITQGNREAMEQRDRDIFADKHHRSVDFLAAATDSFRAIKAARQARKDKREQP